MSMPSQDDGVEKAPAQPSAAAQSSPSFIIPRQGSAGGALVILIGVMCVLAGLALGISLGVERASQAWSRELIHAVTVEIVASDEMTPEVQIEAVQNFLEREPAVAASRPLSMEENRKLIEPWLGNLADIADLPVPQLIDVKLAASAPEDLSDLSARLKAAIPGASLDTHRRWRSELLSLSRTIRAASLGALILVLIATIVTVIFATRAGLIAHRAIIDILHTIGARDSFVSRAFERHFFRYALQGGIYGACIAILAFVTVGEASHLVHSASLARFAPSLTLEPLDFLILASIAPAAAIIATLTARFTVLRALRHMV